MRALLLSLAPDRNTSGRQPFSGTCGSRIAALAGISHEHLYHYFDAASLIGYWPADVPSRLVSTVSREMIVAHERVIFVGRAVASCFGLRRLRPLVWQETMHNGSTFDAAVLPHPSGLNRWYNDPAHAAAARAFLRDAISLRPAENHAGQAIMWVDGAEPAAL